MQFTVVANESNHELRGRVRPIQGRTLFLFLWKLMLFHHLLQDVCHIILVDAGSFIVLHVCVLSALRHSHRGLSCFLMIRSRTFFDGSKGFVLSSKEYKKSEPFSYRKKVRFLQREAPSARFETVQNPCRNRALTLRQTKSLYPPPT